MSIYQVDFRQFISQVLGRLTRQPKMIAWLHALVVRVREIYADFLEYRDVTTHTLSLSTQTRVLEYELNLRWPGAGGGIYIENRDRTPGVFYIYDDTVSGNEPDLALIAPEPTDTAIIYDEDEIIPIGVSFIVWVPADLIFVEAEMKAVVNRFKLVGTTYSILLF
jgi:hypothetical protein